ncbi:hypothetical protein, conserved [Leishmania donovani]|uniref:ERF1 methyltransferase catalytic subunit, putative n=1 Tax=Leishmania donovani TaxID=5661 RepID=A0A3Q8IFZ7_LEIDO|nr:hypothetical protein, conserved [Leishmania donovani]AYU81767.1 eRF1 methyltransferase catalytic subunit, putative [Leishmania donovani]TPP43731.1 Methyltransferase domain family protein [Leishmania donovani]CBZ36952.1 hypothetical protein, conserved [Leishmania donovani]
MSSIARASYSSPEYTHCIRDSRFRHNVYEPEADTFLFLEALDKDAELLRSIQPDRCVEVGCGSGTVITHLRCLLMPSVAAAATQEIGAEKPDLCCRASGTRSTVGGPMFCAVDVNPLALEATAITWTETLLKYFRETVLTDFYGRIFQSAVPTSLAAPVVLSAEGVAPPSLRVDADDVTSSALSASTFCLHRFHGDLLNALPRGNSASALFDVVLFNPPYVPTSLEELQDAIAQRDVITTAWCGGPRGRVVLDRFLRQLPSVLSRRGVCYLVLIKENNATDVVAFAQTTFREHLRCSGTETVKDEDDMLEASEVTARYTGEHLSVYRLRYLPRFQTP